MSATPPHPSAESESVSQNATLPMSEAVEDVFRQTEVTIAGLRTLYSEIIVHVEETYGSLGNETLDALFERCRTDFVGLAEGRLGEISDALERIRRFVYRLEHRIELLERVPLRQPTQAQHETPNDRPPRHIPSSDSQRRNPIVRPLTVPSPPFRPITPIPFRLDTHEHVPASPRINPAVFHVNTSAPPPPPNDPMMTALPWHYGPLDVNVNPLTTLLPEFRAVIDYRSSRLRDTSPVDNLPDLYRGSASKVVSRMRTLMPRLANFTGKKPISLLRFLRDFRQAADGVRLSEGAAVTTISWFLESDALKVYSTQAFSGIRRTMNATTTWPLIVNTLLERYLTDEILGDAYTKVTTAIQTDNEDESAFLSRIETYADECCGVFDDYLLVNYFLRGLRPTIRPVVSQRLYDLPTERRTNLNVVRRLAQAEGDAYRARLPPPTVLTNPVQRSAQRRASGVSSNSTLLIEPPYGTPTSMIEPVMAVTTNAPGTTPTTEESADVTIDITGKIDKYFPTRIPDLTTDQQAMAHAIIPPDNEWHQCWLCREYGHTLYGCTYLTRQQQLYAAYRNYVHQYETRPHTRNMLEQKVQEHLGKTTPTPDGRDTRNDQRTRPAPNDNGRPRSILRRPNRPQYNRPVTNDSRRTQRYPANQTSRLPQNVLDAVMTIQSHVGTDTNLPVDDLLAQLETVQPTPDQPHSAHDVPPLPHEVNDTDSTDTDDSKKG